MGKEGKLPLVAICGRPNVGKSTLFNRITGRFRAIVHKQEGITRDRCYGNAEWQGRAFRVVDTGGIVEQPTDPISHKIQEQVRIALEEADVIVFVLDGRDEITRVDLEIRDELYTYHKPVVLAVNKLDNEELAMQASEFYSLGLGDPIPVSAGHGMNIDALTDAIMAHLPPVDRAGSEPSAHPEAMSSEPEPTRVAVVGRPNVGKSSFVNALLNEERLIVTEIPGTTLDSIDIEFRWKGKEYVLMDTAGLRRKAAVREDVERFSLSRSLRSIRQADVVLAMADPTEGLTEQDKRILEYIREQGKAAVWVWTKWDLIEDKKERLKRLKEEIAFKAPFCHYLPMVTISNVTRRRLYTVFEHVDRVAEEACKRISTAELNRLMQDIRTSGAGAFHKGHTARVLYATQTSVKPTTFVLFVNQKRLFHFSYMRHIENRLREKFGFEGVPIRIELRERSRTEAAE